MDRRGYRGSRPGGFFRPGSPPGAPDPSGRVYDDEGSAARFFYCPKPCPADRGDAPPYEMPLFGEAEPEVRNEHPTVKPTSLMHWLLTMLATPDGGVVLDPFMGSGTTLRAARDLGLRAVGIDIEEKWCELAAARLKQ